MKIIRLCLIIILFFGVNAWVFEEKLGDYYFPISKDQPSFSAQTIPPIHPVTQMNPTTRVSKVNTGPINVACVFATGGLGDMSFNDMAYQGFQKAQTDGLLSVFDYFEPATTSDFEPMLNTFASSGAYDLIIAVGFLQKTAVEKVASFYNTQPFLLIDEIAAVGNVRSVVFRENEGSFLAGAMASLMTKTGKIGFIGGMDVPLIREFWAGFKAGAFYEKNGSFVEVLENFVGLPGDSTAWNDPATAKAMAEAMWAQGVDVIFAAAGNSGLGVHESANEQGPGFYSIGVDADQDYLYPGSILTSMIKRLDIAVYNGILDVYNSNWSPDIKNLGLAENGVGISNLTYTRTVIGPTIIQEVNDTVRNKIISEELTVPLDSTSLDQWITDKGISFSISIFSNGNFSSLGFPGAGTSTDPYRIEGFNLFGRTHTLISISDTTDYFTINNNVLEGLLGCYWVINLHNVIHGTIENNIIEMSDGDGIALYFSDNNIIDNNTVTNCRGLGIRLENTTDNNLVVNNAVVSNGFGIWIGNSCSDNSISNNYVYENHDGIALTTDTGVGFNNNNTISHNTIFKNQYMGIELSANSDDNNISYNLIINNNGAGIFIGSACDNNIIQFNDFSGNYPTGFQAIDLGINNDFTNNYWNDWDGTGSYSFEGNDDASPQMNPNHISAPDITAPTSSITTMKGSITIQWKTSTDTFNHPITYSIYYYTKDGMSWSKIVSGLTGTSYTWDLTRILNGTEVLLKVEAEDSLGFICVSISDSTFIIENPDLISTTTPKTSKISPAWTIHLIFLSLGAILPLRWIKRKK
ncbi:MAG: BMP family ABC transporter substrate-binding protein [Candidatus Hodarchaeota archaeon]